MRLLFRASHSAKVCSVGFSARATSTLRAPQKMLLEVALELEHVAEIVGAGETEAAVHVGRHVVVAHLLAQRPRQGRQPSRAPVRCSPAMPTVLPINSWPLWKMP